MELLLPSLTLILWGGFAIVICLLPVIALISVVRSTFNDSTTRLMWVLIILILPFFGPVIYFIIGRKQRTGTA